MVPIDFLVLGLVADFVVLVVVLVGVFLVLVGLVVLVGVFLVLVGLVGLVVLVFVLVFVLVELSSPSACFLVVLLPVGLGVD